MDSSTRMDISPTRNVSRKRSREEHDETSLSPRSSRPAKRPAIGMQFPSADSLELPKLAQPMPFEDMNQKPNINTWRLHDDWVNRTGSLRLDSPIPALNPDETDNSHSRFVMGTLVPLNVHPQYLPTPKHSPLMTPVHGHVDLAVQNEIMPNMTHKHIPAPSTFVDASFEDAVMQSPEARSGSPQKKRIYMGYREDCESCRLRVPGHYNHYI